VDTDGMGLGLYIVKSILTAAGGSISFESEKDKGTTFIVKLPETGMKKKEGAKNLM
jgi:signal transduction histidine kinase